MSIGKFCLLLKPKYECNIHDNKQEGGDDNVSSGKRINKQKTRRTQQPNEQVSRELCKVYRIYDQAYGTQHERLKVSHFVSPSTTLERFGLDS